MYIEMTEKSQNKGLGTFYLATSLQSCSMHHPVWYTRLPCL